MIIKRIALFACLACVLSGAGCSSYRRTPDAGTVYLFAYTTTQDQGKSGMHYAWSDDDIYWHPIGKPFAFFTSDYGNWSTEKRMRSPFLFCDTEGTWHCVWGLNEQENVFAHAASEDLIYWGRQSYPTVGSATCIAPVASVNEDGDGYVITWKTGDRKYFRTTTTDFKTFSEARPVQAADYVDNSVFRTINGESLRGQLYRISQAELSQILAWQRTQDAKADLYSETLKDDGTRFEGLKPITADFKFYPGDKKAISDMLIGVFFEDISYGADGGLYAELIQNRDFEYDPSDKLDRDRNWNSYYAWQLTGGGSTFVVETTEPLHGNTPHYALMKVSQPGASLTNTGFDGIVLKQGCKYDYSYFVKVEGTQRIRIALKSDGVTVAQDESSISGTGWLKVEGTLTASADARTAVLSLEPLTPATYRFDMVSLFPQETFKGRKNGLRKDLAQAIADLHPRFVRFPGGCVAHGDGLDNMYRWKNTIGPLEARKGQRNIWNYRQSCGLGFHEYFQFCEDIGAEPLPVLPAGVPCQNSRVGGGGQQGGIPMNEMGEYIQDVLDLIEYANGSVQTTWGRKRAENGHPEPFHLKYIGIGNEDLITDVFEERFTAIYRAVKEQYPQITVIGTVGPFYEGTDYTEGWELARKLKLPMVDEHYYVSPGWYIHNQHFYDKYDRKGPKVYLGEYASHASGKPNNMESALTEALHLVNIERNADVVAMTSYAPLLARENHTNWTPDLIFFNGSNLRLTTDYEVQRLFGNNSGDIYLKNGIETDDVSEEVLRRIATSVVKDSKTGDIIIKAVNLLPVDVTLNLEAHKLGGRTDEAVVEVLSGRPQDQNANIYTTSVQLYNLLYLTLKPYSLTVLRVKAQ